MHALRRMPWLVVLVLLCGTSQAQTPADPPADAQIDLWVQDLGALDFETREAAEAQLFKTGVAAEAALRAVAESSDDLEVRTRAKRLLVTIANMRWRQTPPGYEYCWSLARDARSTLTPTEPCLAGDVLVYQDGTRYRAIDIAVGRVLWERPLPRASSHPYPSLQSCNEGFVEITGARYLTLIDARTGVERWRTETGGVVAQWTARSDVIVANYSQKLLAMDAVSGQTIYAHKLSGPFSIQHVSDELIVLWSSAEGKIAVHQLVSGERIADWTPEETPAGVIAVDAKRVVQLNAQFRTMTAYDHEGEQLWTTELPVNERGGRYVPGWFTSDGRVLAAPGVVWNLGDGSTILSQEMPGVAIRSLRLVDQITRNRRAYPSTPVLNEQMVFFPALNGQLMAFDLASLSQRWIFRFDDSPAVRVNIRDPFLIAATEKMVICLKRTSGE